MVLTDVNARFSSLRLNTHQIIARAEPSSPTHNHHPSLRLRSYLLASVPSLSSPLFGPQPHPQVNVLV